MYRWRAAVYLKVLVRGIQSKIRRDIWTPLTKSDGAPKTRSLTLQWNFAKKENQYCHGILFSSFEHLGKEKVDLAH